MFCLESLWKSSLRAATMCSIEKKCYDNFDVNSAEVCSFKSALRNKLFRRVNCSAPVRVRKTHICFSASSFNPYAIKCWIPNFDFLSGICEKLVQVVVLLLLKNPLGFWARLASEPVVLLEILVTVANFITIAASWCNKMDIEKSAIGFWFGQCWE